MDFKIEQEDDSKRGMFFAKQGEKPAGILSYIWSDNKHMVVYFTESLSGFEGKGVEQDLVDAACDYARIKEVKIVPVSSMAKSTIIHDSKKYSDVIETAE